jgi:thiamine-phosphate pyrophosphorylase
VIAGGRGYNRFRVLLYYITDRRSFGGTAAEQRTALLRRIAETAGAGVDYIQLREKDLAPRELERLATEAQAAVRDSSSGCKLLINGRTDIALACDADGVHLPAGEIAASEVLALWAKSTGRQPVIAVSAHSAADVRYAHAHGSDFAVLAPIFEKAQLSQPGVGLDALRECCGRPAAPAHTEQPRLESFPVLALGGVTVANARACLEAGAAGVAGIRLFQSGDVAATVRRLREIAAEVAAAKVSARD